MAPLPIRASASQARTGQRDPLVGDHIIQRSQGGLNVLSNYEVRCRSCNTARGNREGSFLTGANGDAGPDSRETQGKSPANRMGRAGIEQATLGLRVPYSRWLSPRIQRCIEDRGADDQAPDEVEGEQQGSGDTERAVGVGALLDET
jgi:HNH endonuclease